MRILISLASIIIITLAQVLNAQVVISPYVAFTDQSSKSTTMLVTNQTLEPQEVHVSFKFGYPVSDENGNVTMRYGDTSVTYEYDLTKMVKVFPKKFFLNPGEQQTVRVSVKPTANMPEGTYWTRIVTSSQPKSKSVESSENFSAKINFVLSQVTTILYKNKRFENDINIAEVKESVDKENLNLVATYAVNGDYPFFVENDIRILDANNKVVREKKEFFTVYYSLTRRSFIERDGLAPGNYSAEINLSQNTTSDVPLSDKPLITPIKKKVYFTIE